MKLDQEELTTGLLVVPNVLADPTICSGLRCPEQF
jgi:hypothetical protein